MADLTPEALAGVVRAQRRGEPRGIASICSANPFVLQAALEQALEDGSSLLVESTSNQVNPEGGYTGQKPADFAAWARGSAREAGLPPERLVLGGDHLGPHPYRARPAAEAMAAGCEMVRQYVRAGYAKIHLDASMRLGGDPGPEGAPPAPELVTARTVELAAAAEAARCDLADEALAPVYVIGTDVPPPGGETSDASPPAVTSAAEATRALGLARDAFRARSLESAWQRVIALVVQPGVDFTAARVFEYDRAAGAALRPVLDDAPGMVFEAHSTDYQPERALRGLVADGFGVLKVGPWLTYAFRQAVFALEAVEREWLGGRRQVELSGVRDALEAAMDADPRHWRGHHRPGETLRAERAFGYSDRVRYYWPAASVQAALARLRANLHSFPPPLPLLGQYLPGQYEAVREGRIGTTPEELVASAVRQVIRLYARVCAGQGLRAERPA
ncbi:MAG TPA: class II D-tagatose-bisphosphate aldolase, non-catalytic subunit [Vicinamibacteria bacterium]|nr:class II D-tagatose-bisphosphate aldolase, non-catalytic subunit [Vicinamibacteria bacterium]